MVYAATVSESQRVMRWRMILEEFGPDIVHIKGEQNTSADALSRLPKKDGDVESKEKTKCEIFAQEIGQDAAFPLEYASIAEETKKELKENSELQDLLKDKESGYYTYDLEGHKVVMHKKCIYVPKPLQGRLIRWYHHYLCHLGV